MSGNGNPGVNKLGQVLQERMKACGASPLLLDFGTIQGDMSLITNTFPIPIPKTDYTVCRQLTLGATGGSDDDNGRRQAFTRTPAENTHRKAARAPTATQTREHTATAYSYQRKCGS